MMTNKKKPKAIATGSVEFALLRSAIARSKCKTCKKMMDMLDTVTGQLEKVLHEINN